MNGADPGHIPVLLDEVIAALSPVPGATLIDATAGRGGHASEIARRMGTGRVLLLDRDQGNLAFAVARARQAAPHCEVIARHSDFRTVDASAHDAACVGDMLLADLGVSSNQLDESERGFGFQQDGPLDMRLDTTGLRSASDLVRDSSEEELADIIFHLGEDPYARRIARKVAQSRAERPITTTAHLARLVREAYGSRARASRVHPATRTFMALRIAVNDELGALGGLLQSVATAARSRGHGWLARDARVAVISFHSLEDRQVKRVFAALSDEGVVKRTTRKPVIASLAEVERNSRARSAKLRAISFISTPPDTPA
ncbi:MAG: 16S rRNA (cytosine(1402)-N(4))-methyltransferase RsmH [Phycisphaerales bacterium]|nr:16S rRNA (cytosine(1402)-N(4))-methyltransferase RsmH [Phycisphaerales bacterium]